jgi:hypothetical protein
MACCGSVHHAVVCVSDTECVLRAVCCAWCVLRVWQVLRLLCVVCVYVLCGLRVPVIVGGVVGDVGADWLSL